jgi:hypothetical protein
VGATDGRFLCIVVSPYGRPTCVNLQIADDKSQSGRWFDTKRLEVLDTTPVMAVPTFERIDGGQELPGYPSQPVLDDTRTE